MQPFAGRPEQGAVQASRPEAPRAYAAPGARAAPATSSALWSEFFATLGRADCSLSTFFHSLRLLPGAELGLSSSEKDSSTRRVWPMPLPYPSLLQVGAGAERCPQFLGRP